MQIASRLIERYCLYDSALENAAVHCSSELLQYLKETEDSIESLLLETDSSTAYSNAFEKLFLAAYYGVRSLLSDRARAELQRRYLLGKTRTFPAWPVDFTVDELLERQLARLMREAGVESVPFIWFWPNGSTACAIVTHDVETERGRQLCPRLIEVDESFGIRASFQIIPEKRYQVTPAFLESIRSRNFEIAIHDLNHDGRLFLSRQIFSQRASRINRYGKQFGARGFRAGVMYRNQQWFGELEFEFDMSVPNTAKLEPQGGGCCTVMPYFIGRLLEIPLTTTQDYTLFRVLRDFSPELWFQQVNAIYQKHGLISISTHPDYIMEPSELASYRSLLECLSDLRERERLWIPLPYELNLWWRQRAGLRLAKQSGDWRIIGEGADRACVAHAVLSNDSISYVLNGKEIRPAASHCRGDDEATLQQRNG